jgi:hypothetical protein
MTSVPIPLAALKPDNRITIRGAVNPYDKATIFSIYPMPIHETKVTLQPGDFQIPAGMPNKPSRLVIGSSSWWRDIDPEQPLLEIPVSAVVVADSVVRDYNNSRLGSNMGDSIPGLFYLPGDIPIKDLVEKYPQVLETAIVKQRAWYNILVKLADALWARTNGNPLAIPDDCRLAARELSYQRDWATNFSRIEMIACVACGMLRNPNFPICSNCKNVVDRKRAEELGLVFAKM